MVVSIIVPCYNIGPDSLKVLRALDAQDFERPFEVIVVDDQSEDNTFEIVSSFVASHYQLHTYRLPRKGGPGAARNLGLEVSKGEIIIFIGDDTVPSPSFVRHHVALHAQSKDNKVAVLGRIEWPGCFPVNSLMRHICGIGAQQFSYYYFKPGQEYDYRHFYTSNISICRTLLESEKIGFRGDIFPFDDVELAYRLSKHGLKIHYYPQPLVEHYHYHTVWTFARRQWNAGFSAWKLIRCHPETLTLITRPIAWIRKLAQGLSKIRSSRMALDAQTCEQAALRFVSFYEWRDNSLIDFLYLNVLEYFYVKGLVDGLAHGRFIRGILHQSLQASMLIPAIRQFVIQARANSIDLPEGYQMFDRT